MLIVLADLIADLSMHIPGFPIGAGDLQRLSSIELGPGGACNVAIAAARLGLDVACLGEVGDDRFGRVVIEGLQREGVDVSAVAVTPGAQTPVAGVVVDPQGEPAYLGHAGSLQLTELPQRWHQPIGQAQALFADGWAESAGIAGMVLMGLRLAHETGVDIFFDPGPGNPDIANDWHLEAARLATVLLVNQSEGERLTGLAEPAAAAQSLASLGPELVVVKLGAAGCLLLQDGRMQNFPGFPVTLVDATGAGDSLAAAVIFGWLRRLAFQDLGVLANAAGAAKVAKRGTGHHVPRREEILAVLERFGYEGRAFSL